MDWVEWHEAYGDETSPLSRRLCAVQRAIREHLDTRADGPIRVVSACAGQGHDLLEVLATHPARDRVTARLVELDPRNVALTRAAVTGNALTGIEVVEADAGHTDAYAGAVPADLVLFCGVFGNITDADVEATVQALPQFCAPRATVVWTRVRAAPDLTPAIRRWFAGVGFEEVRFDAPDDVAWTVGVHRLTGVPQALEPGRQVFRFGRRPVT